MVYSPERRIWTRISIHAPARGATLMLDINSGGNSISIHAPARGATVSLRHRQQMSSNFNPRSREGSDLAEQHGISGYTDFNPRSREGSDDYGRYQDDLAYISIHAPARGATIRFRPRPTKQFDFNPRSREGSDYLPMLLMTEPSLFQSTLPRGERRCLK